MLLKPLVDEVADSQGLPREGCRVRRRHGCFAPRRCRSRASVPRAEQLIRNAVQAIESVEGKTDGEIRVAAHREGRKVVIDVTDNGAGIPAEGARKSFQGVSGVDEKGRHGTWPRHRGRTCAGPRRHADACRKQKGRPFPIELPDRRRLSTRTAGPEGERASPPPEPAPRALRSPARPTRGGFAARLRRRTGFLPARDEKAPVAQLDRAPDYESGGRGFKSFPARQ